MFLLSGYIVHSYISFEITKRDLPSVVYAVYLFFIYMTIDMPTPVS